MEEWFQLLWKLLSVSNLLLLVINNPEYRGNLTACVLRNKHPQMIFLLSSPRFMKIWGRKLSFDIRELFYSVCIECTCIMLCFLQKLNRRNRDTGNKSKLKVYLSSYKVNEWFSNAVSELFLKGRSFVEKEIFFQSSPLPALAWFMFYHRKHNLKMRSNIMS